MGWRRGGGLDFWVEVMMRMPLKGEEWEARVVEEVTTLACLGCFA